MATHTKPRRTTARRASSPHQGRFARNATASRGQGLRRRRQPQPTGVKKLLTGLAPGAIAKKAAPTSKKGAAGGLALAAAAAGVMLKNRGKLAQLRQGSSSDRNVAAGDATIPPAGAGPHPAL